MLILGIHRDPYHTTGAAVLHDDGHSVNVVAVSQERLDRSKNSNAYPDESIDYCLRAVGASDIGDCDLVVADYICRPTWRTFPHYQPYLPLSLSLGQLCGHPRSTWRALRFYLQTARRLRRVRHRISPDSVHFVNHHLAHACSAFYGSGFNDAAILVADGHGTLDPSFELKIPLVPGNGVFETQSIYTGERGCIQSLEHTSKTGVGMFYEAFTKFLGFGELQEGKTMGLAPYGQGDHARLLDVEIGFSGVETDYSSIADIWADRGNWINRDELIPCEAPKDQMNDYYSRIAWEVQNETERAMVHLAEHARDVTGKSRLCIAGGVGLNSVANNRIVQEGIFDEVWIQPASSDTGIPLGCALYGYYHIAGGEKQWRMDHAYLGRKYAEDEIRSAIGRFTGKVETVEQVDHVYDRVAKLLADGNIVGWFQGGSEYGPRALGHRSILVDPRRSENKDILNSRVKHRESFRPFAPSVLKERAGEFFELDVASPYMLLVPAVRDDAKDRIPAVVHVDKTARVQTVTREENGVYYDLIKAFGKLTGVPVLLNTSFNVNGEPIVESPDDAIRCFLGTEIDYLVLGATILRKVPSLDHDTTKVQNRTRSKVEVEK